MLPLYIARQSPVHRLPTGVKLALLLAGSMLIAFLDGPLPVILVLLGIAGLYVLSRLPFGALATTLQPLFLIGSVIFLLQLALSGWPQAAAAALRMAAFVLLASLVTLTTPLSEMIEVLTHAVSPLARFGLSPTKLGLAIALTIRFIPTLTTEWQEIQHARMARGGQTSSFLAIGPLALKILSMTNALGDAIAARDFDGRK